MEPVEERGDRAGWGQRTTHHDNGELDTLPVASDCEPETDIEDSAVLVCEVPISKVTWEGTVDLP